MNITTIIEIHKSASESSISESSIHSNNSTKLDKAESLDIGTEATSERRKNSFSGTKSLHEIKYFTVEGIQTVEPKEG